jgi:predicted GNAT family acetyltransferase
MDADGAALWMLGQIEKDQCIYQDDVVDYLIKAGREDLLRENADGNQVVGAKTLAAFRKLTEVNVVWVKPDRYWRWRVPEDEPGRDARG